MLKNVSGQKIGAQLVSATDGSAFTGSVTVSVTGDAGTQATGSVGSGACTHEGNGYHTYAPAQAETNYDLIAFTFTGSGAVPVTVQVYTLPTTGVLAPGTLGHTITMNGSGKVSGVVLTDTVTTYTGNTVQTGDSYPIVSSGTSGNAALKTLIDTLSTYVDTEVAAIKAKTDNLPVDPADASDIAASFSTVNSTLATIAAYIDTEVAAIKAKTDNLPSDPADASDIASSFSTVAATLATIAGYIDTEVAAIKAKTDQLAFTTTNRVDAQVFGIQAGAITAAAIATDAIDADALAADAIAEINATVDQALTDYGALRPGTGADEFDYDQLVLSIMSADRSTYNESGSFGEVFNSLVMFSHKITTGSTASTAKLNNASSSVDDFYNGCLLVITSGTGVDQVRLITDYVGATRVCTLDRDWITTPANLDDFAILPMVNFSSSGGASLQDILDGITADHGAGDYTSGGAGAGARTVTLTVDDGTDPLESARIRVTKGAESYILSTDVTGIATFNLDDGTWTVSISLAGYQFAGTTLVVNGTETATYSMTAVSVTASEPGLTTGLLTSYSKFGLIEPGSIIYVYATSPMSDAGFAIDSEERAVTAGDDGTVQVTNMFGGVTYGLRRGPPTALNRRHAITVTIPDSPNATTLLDSLIGAD